MNEKHFDFGKNWKTYSKKINDLHILQAESNLKENLTDLKNKTFLDVGCGSGIHSLAALNLGAKKIVATDFDPISVETTSKLLNSKNFDSSVFNVFQDDILNTRIVEKYDIVYSWGVLHHTGNMWSGIEKVTEFVKNDGSLFIAIYVTNRFSKTWKKIKKTYTYGNIFTKFLLSLIWYPLHFLRKVLNGSLLNNDNRGMLWFYDSKDWLGGYPYEDATKDEIVSYLNQKNFTLVKSSNTKPSFGIFGSGCAEYVFKLSSQHIHS